jgi:hypothetical protein
MREGCWRNSRMSVMLAAYSESFSRSEWRESALSWECVVDRRDFGVAPEAVSGDDFVRSGLIP